MTEMSSVRTLTQKLSFGVGCRIVMSVMSLVIRRIRKGGNYRDPIRVCWWQSNQVWHTQASAPSCPAAFLNGRSGSLFLLAHGHGHWLAKQDLKHNNSEGGWYDWKPSSSSNCSIRGVPAYPLMVLWKLDRQLPFEQFEAAVSQSAVPFPPVKNTIARSTVEHQADFGLSATIKKQGQGHLTVQDFYVIARHV